MVYRGRLRWRLTGRPFPSGHPRTLRRVLDPGPDQLRDNISLVRARGGHGTVLLELACSRMLRGEKLMSRELFAGRKGKGKNKTCKFLPCHYLNSKTLVGGKGWGELVFASPVSLPHMYLPRHWLAPSLVQHASTKFNQVT